MIEQIPSNSLVQLKPLLADNGDDQFTGLAGNVDHLAAFKTMLLQPFTAQADDRESHIAVAAIPAYPAEAFVADGQLSYMGHIACFFLFAHGSMFVLQSKDDECRYFIPSLHILAVARQ